MMADGAQLGAARFEPIASTSESTVVARFEIDGDSATGYQSEADLEKEFIQLLQGQAYEYVSITSEEQLIANLRQQIGLLNGLQFSNSEWEELFTKYIAAPGDQWLEKTKKIHEDNIFSLTFDDGVVRNVKILDRTNVHNNRLQVINQYAAPKAGSGRQRQNRYDVTILVNGLPIVHVELKRRGVSLHEAFNQIDRYSRESFWSGSGLFDYVQLFVISNGTFTKYYSNTTRQRHLKDQETQRRAQSSNTFEFTSWWADGENRRIADLMNFGRTFFAKHTLLNILVKYCVLTVDNVLLVMRPYQIVAAERIIDKIRLSSNYKLLGKQEAGGYIWHTTGSGKTLTSFKTAQLATGLPGVDKVLFIVDRQDLDYQTIREYDKFKKGAANSNASSKILAQQLEDPEARIIITTIQKLANFITKHPKHEVYAKHVVLIFDECHRSQFGKMHQAIVKHFKQYNLFGFTGTPIFDDPDSKSRNVQQTTAALFGHRLHTYTIVDAIDDNNVLPFRIDYHEAVPVGDISDLSAVAAEELMLSPQRIEKVASYILENFDLKTRRSSSYQHKWVTNVGTVARRRPGAAKLKSMAVNGFNSILATSSVAAAKAYYAEFQRQQEGLDAERRLKIALIYSFTPNEEEYWGIVDEGPDSASLGDLDQPSRDFLESAIKDYNRMFGTSYDTSGDSFGNYYRDLSQRMKNRELDMAIVVNMFLTGFDATTLNTLWVDKNLRMHGLVQAYSRTNRILNSVKKYGQIVCFRNLEKATEDAIAMFGNSNRPDITQVIVLPPFGELYEQYQFLVEELLMRFPFGQRVVGETAKKDFVQLFTQVLRARNLIESSDEFAGHEILSERQMQDYQSWYLQFHEDLKGHGEEEAEDGQGIPEDLEFDLTLISQVEVDVDYILLLIQERASGKSDGSVESALFDRSELDGSDEQFVEDILRMVRASTQLRGAEDLIARFLEEHGYSTQAKEDWPAFVSSAFEEELAAIVDEHKLQPDKTFDFMVGAVYEADFRTDGTRLNPLLPKRSRFPKPHELGLDEVKRRASVDLEALFNRFKPLGGVRPKEI